MRYRQASPENQWRDLTEEHEEIKEEIDSAIDNIQNETPQDPLAIVGPYRTGKTQLLYTAFRDAWERGTPALYTDAKSIISEFKNHEDESDIAQWLEDRIADQIQDLNSGEAVDWLPNWNFDENREEWLSDIQSRNLDDDAPVLLLVDEIEQSYAQFREADFVDDANPIRILLDDTSGVYQVWAFGLVAAYELGEADYARFKELRMPILNPEAISSIIEQQRDDVKPEIATGIWWLSRGRIGWVRKLIDELPANPSEYAQWVRQLSEEDLDGLRILNNEAWTEHVSAEKWDSARSSILFLQGKYEDWEISHQSGITISDASSIIYNEIVSSNSNISGDAKQIINKHTNRLLTNIIPGGEQLNRDQKLIPINLLNEIEFVESFLELLTDLILSFEASISARAEAVRIIDEFEAGDLRSEWTDHLMGFDSVEEYEDTYVWTIDLSIINRAFPSLAVDPSILTEGTVSKDLFQSVDEGIEIELGLSTNAIQTNVAFCPTEDIFDKYCDRARKPQKLKQTFILFTNEKEENTDLDPTLKKLQKHGRLHLVYQPKKRIWDFVLHLDAYLDQEHDEDRKLSSTVIQEVLSDVDRRDYRSTITKLYNQLEEVASAECSNAIQNFRETVSRHDVDVPIWSEELSGEAGPPGSPPGIYGTPGGRARGKYALAFLPALSEIDIHGHSEPASIRVSLKDGKDSGLIRTGGGSDFEFTEWLDSTLINSGFTEDIRKRWQRYRVDGTTRDPCIERVQELLEVLIKDSPSNCDETLTDLLKLDRPESIPVISQTDWDDYLTQGFVEAILLDKLISERSDQLSEYFDDPKNKIQTMDRTLGEYLNEIRDLNRTLTAPDDHGEVVEIGSGNIQDRRGNLERLESDIERIENTVQANENYAGIALLYYTITDNYIEEFNNQIETIRETVRDMDLFEIQDLKGLYTKIESRFQSYDRLYEYVEYDEDEAINNLHKFADTAFDFRGQVATKTIEPQNKEALETLRDEAEEYNKTLRELNEKVERFEQIDNQLSNSQEQLKREYREFATRVMED